MRNLGKVLSGLIMLAGLILGVMVFGSAKSAPQALESLIPVIVSYVSGRMIETFTTIGKK